MASLLTTNFAGLPPGSPAQAAAQMANAAVAYELSSAFTAGGVTTATTTTKAKIVNTIVYTVGGKFFSKAATDNFWTLGGAGSATVVPANGFQKYLLLLDNTGAASVLEGTPSIIDAAHVGWGNIAAQSPWAAFLTAIGGTKIVAATLTIATDGTHTFTPGTTAVATGSGITATFIDGIDQSILPLLGNETGVLVGAGG